MSRLAKVFCRASNGLDAPLVRVEVHIAGGLPGITIVGLPEASVREARDRVRAALQSSGFSVPPSRITINLAPAELPKHGSRFDLAIALGILQASGVLDLPLAEHEFLAELSLDGGLRSVRGILPAASTCAKAGRRLILAPDALAEAAVVPGLAVGVADSLLDVCAKLREELPWPVIGGHGAVVLPRYPALADVRGQAHAKRALEIAAAGGHNLLLSGPPGSGKSMLAARLPGLLPEMSASEALELAGLESLSTAGFQRQDFGRRPFRCPHHTASAVALVGGGAQPRPGEISLATHGVLCLDEMAEFPRHVLEVLRGPMESGVVSLARAAASLSFPAKFQLVATMNPCPCGFLGDPGKECRCTSEQVRRYANRISGPLLDRIDLRVAVARPPAREVLLATAPDESDAAMQQRIAQARARMMSRQGRINASLDLAALRQHAALARAEKDLLEQAAERLHLSARAIHRVLRVARSIADLAQAQQIARAHLIEALSLRQAAN